MGRPKNIHTPIKYHNDDDRKQAIAQSKNKYMNTTWSCLVCDNELKMGSKWCHLRSKKHITNTIIKAIEDDGRFELLSINVENV